MARFIRKMARDLSFEILAKQLLRSSTSIGANMREADSASSRKDFANKVTIAKKEAQETEYWLEVIKGADFVNNEENKKELNSLLNECHEIILVLGAIARNSKQ